MMFYELRNSWKPSSLKTILILYEGKRRNLFFYKQEFEQKTAKVLDQTFFFSNSTEKKKYTFIELF